MRLVLVIILKVFWQKISNHIYWIIFITYVSDSFRLIQNLAAAAAQHPLSSEQRKVLLGYKKCAVTTRTLLPIPLMILSFKQSNSGTASLFEIILI